MNKQIRRKEYILFPADIGTHWIGGLYYFKNIIYSILQNPKICDSYNLLIVTTESCRDVFAVFDGKCDMYIHESKSKLGLQLEYINIFRQYKIKYIYNAGRLFAPLRHGKKCIFWIADFQHVYYPEFFTDEIRKKRDGAYSLIAKKKETLVLSSYAARNDFVQFFHGDINKTHVVHFVSYIENELLTLTSSFEQEVLKKYSLGEVQYIYIPNQFWKHKNHITVLKAIELLPKQIKEKYKFVFSGNLNSYKNDEYVNGIKQLIEREELRSSCMLLGFLDRKEQLCIMKNCIFVIQPSLFEGWSTVVEDVKVLDKRIILSDIDVHREQNYCKSTFFSPEDQRQLSQKIMQLIDDGDFEGNTDAGLNRMRNDAKEYSFQFEEVLGI